MPSRNPKEACTTCGFPMRNHHSTEKGFLSCWEQENLTQESSAESIITGCAALILVFIFWLILVAFKYKY